MDGRDHRTADDLERRDIPDIGHRADRCLEAHLRKLAELVGKLQLSDTPEFQCESQAYVVNGFGGGIPDPAGQVGNQYPNFDNTGLLIDNNTDKGTNGKTRQKWNAAGGTNPFVTATASGTPATLAGNLYIAYVPV